MTMNSAAPIPELAMVQKFRTKQPLQKYTQIPRPVARDQETAKKHAQSSAHQSLPHRSPTAHHCLKLFWLFRPKSLAVKSPVPSPKTRKLVRKPPAVKVTIEEAVVTPALVKIEQQSPHPLQLVVCLDF